MSMLVREIALFMDARRAADLRCGGGEEPHRVLPQTAPNPSSDKRHPHTNMAKAGAQHDARADLGGRLREARHPHEQRRHGLGDG